MTLKLTTLDVNHAGRSNELTWTLTVANYTASLNACGAHKVKVKKLALGLETRTFLFRIQCPSHCGPAHGTFAFPDMGSLEGNWDVNSSLYLCVQAVLVYQRHRTP